MDFPYFSSRRASRGWACCSLCGREVASGERGWYRNGTSVCEECFEDFARAELAPFEIVFGEEGAR